MTFTTFWGPLLLSITALSTAWTVLALVMALVTPIRNPVLRRLAPGLMVLGTLAVIGPFAGSAFLLWASGFRPDWVFGYFLALTGVYLAGALVVLFLGNRKAKGLGSNRPWSKAWLMGGAAAGLVGFGLTAAWLDNQADRRAAMVRDQAVLSARKLLPPQPADDANAFIQYEAAWAALGAAGPHPRGPNGSPPDPGSAEVLARVEKTGPVLDLVVRTAGRGVYYEPLDLNHLALCELPDYKKLHVLTYNLAQRAAVRVRREEMEAAWADVNALDQMAGQVRRWPTLAAQMVAAGLSNAYVNALEDFLKKAPVPPSVLDHLPVPLPESTAPDMERALSMEEAALVQLAAGLGSDGYPGFSEGVRLAMDQGDRGRTLTSLLPPVIQYYWRPFLMPEDLAAIREKMALAKADAARPYPQYLMVGSGLARSWETDPGGLITSMMIPDFDQLYRVAAQAQARRELAAAALAVKAFRAQRNAWPETLADLAPRYIAALPPDALTGKPVQLEKSGTGIVLFVQPGSANDPKSQRLQFQLTP